MPNTGLVNGEIVDGSGESYFEGIIVRFRQNVKSIYNSLPVGQNCYNNHSYNSNYYPYNNSNNNIFPKPIVIFKQKVGVSYSGIVVTFRQIVNFRSTFTEGNVVQFKQNVQFTYNDGDNIVSTLRQWVE